MGASKSKAAVGAPPVVEQQTGFNVIVTQDGKAIPKIEGAVSIEDKILQSFEAGKEQGFNSIHKSLDSVAAQVYDNIHEQLLGMQNQQLNKSEELVSNTSENEPVVSRSYTNNCVGKKKIGS